MHKTLSPRWAGTTKKARTEHMRGLARARMAKLTRAARVKIARGLVAARTKKHGGKTNHA